MKLKQGNLPLSELTAIGPLDGRYRERTSELAFYVSEYSLIRSRFEVEAKYLIALSDIKVARKLSGSERKRLSLLADNIAIEDAKKVKKIEQQTRHDVKAMEGAFRDMVRGTSLEDLTEMIHFGLTSEDVNNLAYRLMLERATRKVCIPVLDQLIDELVLGARKFKSTPMLARTHGQAAVPTTIGKELIVFGARLNSQVRKLEKQKLAGKLSGAVGNFNALHFVDPRVNWIDFSSKFVESLGFAPNLATTQINPYEDMIELFQNYQRINGIIVDFNGDMWRYISDDWFVQEIKKGEVGSSTMPQKVNPIDFENSEGNLALANGLFETLSAKLAVSRLQRDLSDSTAIRNIGMALGYSLVGYKSALSGLLRVKPNLDQIQEQLNKDWSILTEAVQVFLRKAKVKDPYLLVASLARGRHISQEAWQKWLDDLPIEDNQKMALRKLAPGNYIGLATEITDRTIGEIRSSRK